MAKQKNENIEKSKISRTEDIMKDAKPLDMSKYYTERDNLREIARKEYENAIDEERRRIEELTCPVCACHDKKRFIHSTASNGIYGPGHVSKITDDYFICNNCGVHYSDLNKKEIKKPLDLFY